MFRSYDHNQGAVFLCLAKVTLKPVISLLRCTSGSMPCCVMLCCEECPAMDVHSVLRYVISSEAQNAHP